jgi:hypothetical protein
MGDVKKLWLKCHDCEEEIDTSMAKDETSTLNIDGTVFECPNGHSSSYMTNELFTKD